MKAIVHHEYGPPLEVLRLEDIAPPTPSDDDVLLRVHAAAVNWADWSITRGVPYALRAGFGLRRPRAGSTVRGTDVAGTVEAVGADVTGRRVGEAVFGWCTGAFAEYTTVPAANLVAKPDGLPFERAAAIPMAGLVALQAMRDIAHVQAGQHVLVNGASGGIGTFTVQIAKQMGAEVTGVCSTANLELVASLGADHVLDYTRDDFTRGEQHYDVILDMADDKPLRDRRRVLTRTGTLIPNSGVGNRWVGSLGRIVAARLMSLIVPQDLHPFLSRSNREDLTAVRDLVAAGDVTPVVGRTYTLAEAAEAVAHVGQGHVRGKVAIII